MENLPLVSICLFCYNQEKYIKQAVSAVLAQTYSPLEIIISDDCSRDSTFEIITEIVNNYNGPHKIVLNHNDKNLGLAGHVSKVLYSIVNGDYIAIVAGDDALFKNYAEEAVEYAKKYPNINMIDVAAEVIDENGNLINTTKPNFEYKHYTTQDYIKLKNISSFAPGRLLKRDFIFSFNPISSSCPTEDSVLVFRSFLTGGFVKINKPLIYYRKHSSNLSNAGSLRKMSNCAIISQYLRDLIHAYDKKIISDKIYQLLLERVNIELRIRNVLYHSDYNSKVKSICVKVIKGLSLLKMKILLLNLKNNTR